MEDGYRCGDRKLYQLILSGETQVHEPVYAQEAQAREENDLGYTYLELDLGKLQIIQYVDGYLSYRMG